MVEARDLSNQTQLWGGAYFPDLSPGPPCCFRFPPRLVPDLLALRSSGKSHTEADARHQGECSFWGTRGSWRCRSSSPRLFRVQTALGWIPVPGWAHRLSPSIPEAVCAQPGPAPDSISCGSWSSPPSTSVPTLRFRRTSQTVPVMFHCEGFTGEEGFEESVPWPISEGRAGGEDVERKRWLES